MLSSSIELAGGERMSGWMESYVGVVLLEFSFDLQHKSRWDLLSVHVFLSCYVLCGFLSFT